MGKCQNCTRNIKIKKGETKCPSCGENPYSCWNCHVEIDLEQTECNLCHFYICNACGSCGKYCQSDTISSHLVDKYGVTSRTAFNIIQEVAEFITGAKRQSCPSRNVPVSYAHSRLRRFVIQATDPRKSEDDREAFNEQFKLVANKKIGETWTINEMKIDGTHGAEMREASFLAVCMGVAEYTKQKSDDDREYYVFKRVMKEKCPHAKFSDLLKKECRTKNCSFTTNDTEIISCPYCGKTLKTIKGHPTFCDLPKRDFVVAKERDDGTGERIY